MGKWQDREFVQDFLNSIKPQLNVKTLEDWYSIDARKLYKHGASALLTNFSNSVFKTLRWVYPEHRFLPWKFHSVPNGWWKALDNQRDFCNWLASTVGVKSDTAPSKEDKLSISAASNNRSGSNPWPVSYDMAIWYDITMEDIARYGGTPVLLCLTLFNTDDSV